MRIHQFLTALVAGTILGALNFAEGAVIYGTVARTGQPAPNTPLNTLFASSFSTPAINNLGQVLFSAQISGGGSSFNTNNVLYGGAPGALQLVARSGNPAPGMPAGVNYSLFHRYDSFPGLRDTPVINDAGQVAFIARVTGGGVNANNDDVVFSGTLAAPQIVAQEGTQTPGTSAGVLYTIPDIHLNDAGQVSLWTILTGTGVTCGGLNPNCSAVFVGTPGAMQLAARQGDPAPGTPDNYGGSGQSAQGPSVFNDAGQVAFWDTVNGPDVVLSVNRYALFAGGVGSMQLAVRTGQPAAGAPPGVNYGQAVGLATPSINDSGQLAFGMSWTTGLAGVDSTNDAVLYAGPIGSPQLIAREGDPAPGTPPGTNYSTPAGGFGKILALNDSGGIYFEADVTGPAVTAANNTAYFAGPWAAPKLIAREGDPAPGTPAGVTFVARLNGGIDGSGFPFASYNDAGQVALLMQLAGTGVTAANDVALYLFDPVAGPVKVVREGDQFDIGGGIFRTIADFGIVFNAGLNDDFTNGLNNNGTLVFGLRFTDNTGGIFTATIPEPATISLLALGFACLLFRYRSIAASKRCEE